MLTWLAERSLTPVMVGLFAVFLAGQIVTGGYEFNGEQIEHGAPAVALLTYLTLGHLWNRSLKTGKANSCQSV